MDKNYDITTIPVRLNQERIELPGGMLGDVFDDLAYQRDQYYKNKRDTQWVLWALGAIMLVSFLYGLLT